MRLLLIFAALGLLVACGADGEPIAPSMAAPLADGPV